MATIVDHIGKPRERTLLLLAYGQEITQQLLPSVVERGNHEQLAQRLHATIAVAVFHQFLHVLRREERQHLQLFTADGVDVHGMLLQFAQQFEGFFPVGGLAVFDGHQFVEQLLPRRLGRCTCGRDDRQAQQQEQQGAGQTHSYR